MAERFLKLLELDFNSEGGLPHAERLPLGEEGVRQLAKVRAISAVARSLQVLKAHFFQDLSGARIAMQRPNVDGIWLTLTRCPAPGIRIGRGFDRKWVFIELQHDPATLLDIPPDARSLGEFALSCWERALPLLAAETDIPVLHLSQSMARFRARGHTVHGQSPLVKIAGSRAKARLRSAMSPVHSQVWLEVVHRDQVLYCAPIWEHPGPVWNWGMGKNVFAVADEHLTMSPALDLPGLDVPRAKIALQTLPQAFQATLTGP